MADGCAWKLARRRSSSQSSIGTRPGSGTGEPGALLYQSNPISGSDGVPFGWRVNVNGAEGVSVNAWVVCQHTE